jgi:hypothetical protein
MWYDSIRSPENNLYRCVEPDYGSIINAAYLRRMNRIQKLGLCTALDSLRNIDMAIDAIIIATGWGCIESTYKFLERMFDQKGLPPNPAAFIQSTHNSIAAQTAIYLNNKSYNSTVTDDRLPFELAMDNAILCLLDSSCRNILLGACDEITPQLTDIFNRMSKFGKPQPYGEGGACFILSKEKNGCIAEIRHFGSVPAENMPETIVGLSEQYSADYIFAPRWRNLPVNIPQILYTNYFGDFPTSAACGFWLAINCLNRCNPSIPHARNIMLVSENRYGMAFITVVSRQGEQPCNY